ncbi:hypothetical protein G7085_16885 [Tessaracoccus sp. HDW20]|uniref:hypothetical protein n=1 Tax=Tessaracoccus coleopterorum TaxID=2714950 RepID=UPI0018D462A0|nr:hypothetical protein [Tessaracoccus coleopterorum]NHB85703.1 hypothetical protein [Tessaracoccus coleopterorum]
MPEQTHRLVGKVNGDLEAIRQTQEKDRLEPAYRAFRPVPMSCDITGAEEGT